MIDDFPYKKYSIVDQMKLFKNAQMYNPIFDKRAELHSLPGITTKTTWHSFKTHFPLTFKGETIVISSPKWSYKAINILPDYYTEYARVKDIGAYQDISPYDYWEEYKEEIIDNVGYDKHLQREELYRRFPKEARQGKITNYLALFKLLKAKKVLDPSAAWGDRMIAALASSGVTHYTGVDPHSRLAPGWRELLRDLAPVSGKNPRNFIFINKPFEVESTEIPYNGEYDVALVSEPPFIGDIYDSGNPDQAKEKYKTLESYINDFLKAYLLKTSNALLVGGYMCLTFLDRKEYQITELQLALIENINPYMHYVGAVFWQGDGGSLTPWWIFQKKDIKISERRLEESNKILFLYQ